MKIHREEIKFKKIEKNERNEVEFGISTSICNVGFCIKGLILRSRYVDMYILTYTN